MKLLYFFGKRLSNGAKINTRNLLYLSGAHLATEKDWRLVEKEKKSNLRKNSLKTK